MRTGFYNANGFICLDFLKSKFLLMGKNRVLSSISVLIFFCSFSFIQMNNCIPSFSTNLQPHRIAKHFLTSTQSRRNLMSSDEETALLRHLKDRKEMILNQPNSLFSTIRNGASFECCWLRNGVYCGCIFALYFIGNVSLQRTVRSTSRNSPVADTNFPFYFIEPIQIVLAV